MKTKENQKKADGKWDISFAPITRYSILFCGLVMLVVLLGGAVLSVSRMRANAEVSLAASRAQVTQRVEGTVSLLESLASLPEFYDPGLPPVSYTHLRKLVKNSELQPSGKSCSHFVRAGRSPVLSAGKAALRAGGTCPAPFSTAVSVGLGRSPQAVSYTHLPGAQVPLQGRETGRLHALCP